MSSRKMKGFTKLKPWQTPQENNLAPSYGMLDTYFLEDERIKALTPSELKVLLAMILHCAGNETFFYSYIRAAEAGISGSTYKSALKKLQEAGFIRVKLSEVRVLNRYPANEITWISDWKTRTPPENKPKGSRGNPDKLKGKSKKP